MNKNDNIYGESREQKNEMQNNSRTNANTNDLDSRSNSGDNSGESVAIRIQDRLVLGRKRFRQGA